MFVLRLRRPGPEEIAVTEIQDHGQDWLEISFEK